MAPPYGPGPGYAPPPPARGGSDKTQLFGILGIVFAFCCPLIGVLFGVLSMNEAKKYGNTNTLGLVAIVLAVVMTVIGIISRFAFS